MRRKIWLASLVVCAVVVSGCRSMCSAQETTRKSIYNAISNDLDVISNDLQVRAESRASSAYTDAVANLAVQTQVAKDLIAKKAETEKPSYDVYNSWIAQLDSAHKAKLVQLGAERDEYLRLWGQRYNTLRMDSVAVKALKDHEKKQREECCRSGLFGPLRQMFGMCGDTSLDVGGVKNLGVLGAAILP